MRQENGSFKNDVYAAENDDVANDRAGPHDDVAVQNGATFRDSNDPTRATNGHAVHGLRVRHVYSRASDPVRAVFRDEENEENARGKDGKTRKNAPAYPPTL